MYKAREKSVDESADEIVDLVDQVLVKDDKI